MILSDRQIEEKKIFNPFLSGKTRIIETISGVASAVSFGLSSYGYDIRLSSKDFRIFQPRGTVVDPKDLEAGIFKQAGASTNDTGTFFLLPANSYALGVSVEEFNMPENALGICMGKSTYARCGLITNMTPVEPGWRGHLTLEFFNASPNPIKVYANEGIAQVLLFEGAPCRESYGVGKYQDQKHEVTIAR